MQDYWLSVPEQKATMDAMLNYNLIEFSNRYNLQLKGGGDTDIFIKLRNARSNPAALKEIAWLYENPLRRLRTSQFVEIPDSVSCFAPLIATAMNIPYITIRDQPKAGRTTATAIGTGKRGEKITILDDVVTNGESKIPAYQECLRMGLKPSDLVVLVDRQQGWQQTFAKKGINLPVWAGMSLHDVRRYLIESTIMQRCDPKIEEKNPIVIALDGKSWEEYLPLLERLRTMGAILKVNDMLFNKGIEWLIPNLQVYGRVMADLKGHDIGNTLANITKHFLANPPWAVTVHASGHVDMIRKVVDAFKGTPTKVLAVTVLTSIDEKPCGEVYHALPSNQVRTLAEIAHTGGVHGYVCSPQEVGMLRGLYPQATLVPAGIRSEDADAGDQKRVGTPRAAWDAGANYIVMGRQLTEAADPIAEMKRVLTEELKIP